jgi:DNA-binding transcriptional regulator YiaG
MNPKERKKLRKYLRWGDIKKIALAANMSSNNVRRWFDGDSKNSAIEPYIITVVNKRRAEIEQSTNHI